MTHNTLAQLSAADLVQAFVQQALLIGNPFRGKNDPGFVPLSKEHEKEEIKVLEEIACEINSRGRAIPHRPLFDHPSFAVRRWATARLKGHPECDEDWWDAAYMSCAKGGTTQQILSLYEFARRPTPTHPASPDMTLAQLLQRFLECGVRHYVVRELIMPDGSPDGLPYDVELWNRIFLEAQAVTNELRTRREQAALHPLLKHKNPHVSCLAATFCLHDRPDLAVPVLRRYPGINGGQLSVWESIQRQKKKDREAAKQT